MCQIVGWIFAVALLVPSTFGNDAEVNMETILTRVYELEGKQRKSEQEIVELKRVTLTQNTLIQSQDERIGDLETQLTSQIMQNDAGTNKMTSQKMQNDTGTSQRMQNDADTNTMTSRRRAPRRHVRVSQAQTRGEKDKRKTSNRIGKSNLIVKRQGIEMSTGVAFTAYLDTDHKYGADQTIKFNQVITNEGNAYNVHTGVFTCPVGGVYLFTFVIGERDDTSARAVRTELNMNNVRIVDGVVDTYHDSQDLQGGNTVTLRLETGDAVWVSVVNEGGHVEGDASYRFTTFTGVYLFA